MGFCVFEQARNRGTYLAVNPNHVGNIELKLNMVKGMAVSLLDLGFDMAPHYPLVIGHLDEVRDTVMQGLQIGMQKVDLDILTGKAHNETVSLLLNDPGRVVAVREMQPDEVEGVDADVAVASQMYFADGTVRVIGQRPMMFAQRANIGGAVPMIDGVKT